MLAVTACTCVRSGNDEGECWRKYEAKKAAVDDRIYGGRFRFADQTATESACAPVSTELECFEFTDGERCIVKRYRPVQYSEANGDVMVCTKAEAQAIIDASNAPFYPDGRFVGYDNKEAWQRANRESVDGVDKILSRIRRGEHFTERESISGDCV